jgi:hypothetical protein
VWSPDGRFVVFASLGNGLFWTRADGAGQPQPLTQSKTIQVPQSFTADGKRLAYGEFSGVPQIWTVSLEENDGQLKAGKPEQFLQGQYSDVAGDFSPDGHWLAYQSNESGKFEVYVRAFPPPASGQGGKWQISNSGGTVPKWLRNGRELLYQSGGQIMTASYRVNGDTFEADKPQVWIAKLGGTQWDLAPDGKRVAVLTPRRDAGSTKAGPRSGDAAELLQRVAAARAAEQMIGQSIGVYRITAKLGAGGMGEVYRATDTKLHRDVAIKVLRESFAQDAERMARFTREAQVLASLNHPN